MKHPRIISGHYVQGSFGSLPLSGDRARASLHFASQLAAASASSNIELARWYFRASLSEFKSIFDLLTKDMRNLGLADAWGKSRHKSALECEPTVAILRKVRDFAIHSAIVSGEPKVFRISGPDGAAPVADLQAIIIERLDKDNPAVRRDIVNFSHEQIAEFNSLSSKWPADFMMQIAIYSASEPIGAFMNEACRNGT